MSTCSMGFYSRYIFPHVLDLVMANPEMRRCRQAVLDGVAGEVLEIGFGTGRNLEYYPEGVTRLTTVDANPGMLARARRRSEQRGIAIDARVVTAEQLPLETHRFDVVVSTWTLCSIAHVDRALQEVQRVLKPGGRFVFVEHGASRDPGVRHWQDRLTPLFRAIGDGCRPNRDIRALVGTHLHIDHLQEFYLDRVPRVGGFTYLGAATNASGS